MPARKQLTQPQAHLHPSPQNKTWPQPLGDLLTDWSVNNGIGFILVGDNESFATFVLAGKPWKQPNFPRRFVVLWQGSPTDPMMILSWRNGLIEEGKTGQGYAYRFVSIPAEPGTDIEQTLRSQLGDWLLAKPAREEPALFVGSHVLFAPSSSRLFSDHPAFLTIRAGGRMEPVLEELDECRRRFAAQIGPKVNERRARVHEKLTPLLAKGSTPSGTTAAAKEYENLQRVIRTEFTVDQNVLPRVLLLGESGTGKTLVARYLAWRLSPGSDPGAPLSRPMVRITLPEYSGNQNQFEYALFGYRGGSYTDDDPAGSKGLLLERLGGVVFFDEIGDANPVIQEKLLAFMDDYRVTPRGWNSEPLDCPMLVVAATNRPLDRWASQDNPTSEDRTRFRNDLYQRFNVVLQLPTLNERRDELPYILDALLQIPAINPEGFIKVIGKQALSDLGAWDFSHGNFRMLERMLRKACFKAYREGRDYLTTKDWPKQTGAESPVSNTRRCAANESVGGSQTSSPAP